MNKNKIQFTEEDISGGFEMSWYNYYLSFLGLCFIIVFVLGIFKANNIISMIYVFLCGGIGVLLILIDNYTFKHAQELLNDIFDSNIENALSQKSEVKE